MGPPSVYLVPRQAGLGPEGPWAAVELQGLGRDARWPAGPGGCRLTPISGGAVIAGGAVDLDQLGRLLDPNHGGPALMTAARALTAPPPPLRLGGHRWSFGRRTYVLGVVNVTPDSFSGDGVGSSPEAALERARELVAAGADAIDLGGESSRPGHQPVGVEEELRRVVPAVTAITRELPVPLFVDTAKARVAAAALGAGASGVNDIWGLRRDREMAAVVAAHGAAVVCMHNQAGAEYHDLAGELARTLAHSLELARGAGVPRSQVVLDPGLGFGKTPRQSLDTLARLSLLRLLGCPLLVGSSRKSLVGWALGNRPVEGRLLGTAATVAWAAAQGADIVRVHDVREMRDVVSVIDRLRLAELR